MDRGDLHLGVRDMMDLEKAAETWLRALFFRQFKDESLKVLTLGSPLSLVCFCMYPAP